MVETPGDEVIDVVAVRQGGMPAGRPVRVTRSARRAGAWIAVRNFNPALVEVIAVQVMEAAVVQIIDVAVVLDGGVATALAVDVAVVAVDGVVGHPDSRLAEGARKLQAPAPADQPRVRLHSIWRLG